MKTITEVPATPRPAHTPGPWTIHESAFSSSLVKELHIGTSTRTAACVYDDCTAGILVRSEVEANARLIASAPDLLAALAGCADALREAGKDFAQANRLAARPNLYELHEQAARAAIAKATGGAQ